MVNNMIRVFKIMTIGLLLLTIKTNVVFAEECSQDELDSLKSLAKKVDIDYNIYDIEKKVFEINVTNVNEYIYILDYGFIKKITVNDGLVYSKRTNTNNFEFIYKIYASEKTNCSGEFLLEKSIFIPKTNGFYNNELCEGIEEFYLCDYWYPLEISYNEFALETEEYKKSIPVDEAVEPIKNNESTIEKFIDFLLENYEYVLSGIIVLGSAMILVVKRIQKRGDII